MERRYQSSNETPVSLPQISFEFERVFDPDEAEFRMSRKGKIRGVDGFYPIKSDEEIQSLIEEEKKRQEWFYQDYWREKGIASEQVELLLENQQITLYNFNNDLSFNDERLQNLINATSSLYVHFPDAVSRLRYILIDNSDTTSIYGDSELYPVNGQVVYGTNAFRFTRRGVDTSIRHRIDMANNLEGTFIHETSHLTQRDFEKGWREKYRWEFCTDNPDWELRFPPEGTEKRYFHKQTGEMAPQYQFACQPEECVNYYAKISMEEDIAESITAYICDPELLKRISPGKFEILSKHDKNIPNLDISFRRIDKDSIQMPEIKDGPVKYYVNES